jgi:plastocyanin
MKADKRIFVISLFVLIAVSGCLSEKTEVVETPASDNLIEIKNFGFSQASITISPGETVSWINMDRVSHTATAIEGSFDSGTLGKDDTFSHTFSERGTFNYLCNFHPNTMKGTIIVQ